MDPRVATAMWAAFKDGGLGVDHENGRVTCQDLEFRTTRIAKGRRDQEFLRRGCFRHDILIVLEARSRAGALLDRRIDGVKF